MASSRQINNGLIILVYLFFLGGCSHAPDYQPKPKGYQRIKLPPHRYRLSPAEHPYSFNVSTAARILPDSFAPNEKHWIFVDYPSLNANMEITYRPLNNNPKILGDLINDSYKYAGKHQIRASSFQETVMDFPNGRKATVFHLTGEVPSPYQFFTTDSTDHFFRVAMYFEIAGKADSLRPVIDYMYTDMLEMAKSLKWRN